MADHPAGGTDVDERIEWRPIPGFEEHYQVSSTGLVRSNWRGGRLLRPGTSPDGYLQVVLCQDDTRSTRRVHRLVTLAFFGPRPPGLEVRHLDGNPANNRVENLKYGNRVENAADRLRHGHHENAKKTHCPRAHPYSAENTYVDATGRRHCKTCQQIHERAYRERLRARKQTASTS